MASVSGQNPDSPKVRADQPPPKPGRFRVEMVEFDVGVVSGEAPIDGADGVLSRSDPGPDLLFEVLTVRVEFLALEDSDYVTGGSVMH